MPFEALVAVHVLAGLACVVAGSASALAQKRRGLHSAAGRVYLAAYAVVFATATIMSLAHWERDAHLFFVGATGFALAALGLAARRRRGRLSTPVHIVAMGGSYVALLTAFYVDNGPRLPLWRLLPPESFWILPSAVGVPLILRALTRHRGGRARRVPSGSRGARSSPAGPTARSAPPPRRDGRQ
ncbi:hypothetical protein [Rubrobacter tropicus]|uniref:hypothetical protein n=1 Tax=Rubrobacter tropicus TaxID=2653851 RepID=UPI001A9DD72F|nr:hypothetical protein [Rubrobacter tropicus]